VAFQKYVIQLAKPTLNVTAHLMLADKTVVAATNGLNQKFRAAYDTTGTRYIAVRGEISADDLSVNLLRVINVDGCCEMVYADDYETLSFHAHAEMLADHYAAMRRSSLPPHRPVRIVNSVSKKRMIKGCNADFASAGADHWAGKPPTSRTQQFSSSGITGTRTIFIRAGKIKMSQVVEDDLDPEPKAEAKKPGLTRPARRWLQAARTAARDTTLFIDREGIVAEMSNWKLPLHFIDFETAMPVIPFKAGRRPYEGIAFQFSHHIVDDWEAKSVRHTGQFLETTPGLFPNYDFVRELKRQLQDDDGSIFRYHNHENSYLCAIRDQLLRDPSEIPDRDELVGFIESVAKPRDAKKYPGDDWPTPTRCMIDLYDLVLRYYYDPAMGGSNSIKQVLPATLNNSDYLKAKYSDAIYGGSGSIPSLNFTEVHAWVNFDESDKVIDPYHSLRGSSTVSIGPNTITMPLSEASRT
jgi:hypothetical protein